MATRKVKLKGLAYWAKVFEDNRDLTGFEDSLKGVGGQTSIDMDLDEANVALLKKSRSLRTGRQSPENEGLTRVKFSRKWEEEYGGGAPVVKKADGTDWDYDLDGPIGNGSTVEVILSVYDTSRKSIVGTRLEKVKVIEHIPYFKDEDEDVETVEETKPKSPSKPLPKVDKDVDDEIPF